jgi:uncharacterized protein (TIGR03089 family)
MDGIVGSRFRSAADDTIGSMWAEAVARAGGQPVVTWYDDGTGERVELSGATLGNWVAKTANLLVDGLGLAPGDVAAVPLPPHWQTAAVLLGCWSAGVVADPGGARASSAVVFAAGPVDTTVPDRYLLGFAPMGLPMRDVPAGWLDYVAEVRGYGDRFTAPVPVTPGDAATPELTHAGLVAAARERAAALGIPAGGRVLVDAAAFADPLDWLLAPLCAGASIVLCGRLDPALVDSRVAAERIDLVLRH